MPNWNRKLTRDLKTREETILRTLDDVIRYATDVLPKYLQTQNQWNHAAILIDKAANGGDIEAATEAVDNALFLSARKYFKPVPPETRSKPMAIMRRR